MVPTRAPSDAVGARALTAANQGAGPVPDGVAAARSLLPRLYAGEDIADEAHRLATVTRASGDIRGACAALYSAMAAAAIAQDPARARDVAATMLELASEHGLPPWESTARQYLARLQLTDGHEDLALSQVVEAELLIDDAPASVDLTVALNGVGLIYSRLGLFEDSERIFARLAQVVAAVDDHWATVAMVHNRLVNQAAWGLSLERNGDRDEAQQRLRIAASQARTSVDMSRSHARHDFGALCLFTELMLGEIGLEAARDRFGELADHGTAEPLSFVRFALAHRLADDGRIEEARAEIAAGLATVDAVEVEPARSMLVWERARIAVLVDPDHEGLRDAWDYARLVTAQVWQLRVRRREAAHDRLHIGRMRREHERVEQASLEDPLTKTANRRRIDRERAALLDAVTVGWVTVAYLDIDDFKAVNDTHGHDLGDAVLRDLAVLLESCTRDTDLVGRYGGDEFIVVAHECTPADADQLSDRLLTAVRGHAWDQLHPDVDIRVSLGLACTREEHHRLFPAADEALYAAKRAGRDRAEQRVLRAEPSTVDGD